MNPLIFLAASLGMWSLAFLGWVWAATTNRDVPEQWCGAWLAASVVTLMAALLLAVNDAIHP